MKSRALRVLGAVAAMVAIGCHRPELTPAGAAVVASASPPAPSCERLADVHGRAGGAIEGSIVGLDQEGLSAFALNALRNAAGTLGADYVYRSAPTFSAPYGHVTLADYNGYAYRCGRERASQLQ